MSANAVEKTIAVTYTAPDTTTSEQKVVQLKHMEKVNAELCKSAQEVTTFIVLLPVVICIGAAVSPFFVAGAVLLSIGWVCNGCSLDARTDSMGKPY
jgi:hypothetical protein